MVPGQEVYQFRLVRGDVYGVILPRVLATDIPDRVRVFDREVNRDCTSLDAET